MRRNRGRLVAAAVVLSLLIFSAGVCVGTRLGQRDSVSFYATVTENQPSSLLVQGLSENDINHRGEFVVSLKNPNDRKAVLDASGGALSLKDVSVGAEVKITYDGTVLESYPAQIRGAYQLRVIG